MRLARLIGAGPAKRLCLLGHRFTAAEGAALGLIDEVVEPDRLEERALAVAAELLAIPFTALLHTKRQIDAAFDRDPAALLRELVAAQEDCLRSPEHLAVMETYREQQARRAAARGEQPS
jgi:enoyl-CoA hydratase/carnithine racemase